MTVLFQTQDRYEATKALRGRDVRDEYIDALLVVLNGLLAPVAKQIEEEG
jgi:hypothetical protein